MKARLSKAKITFTGIANDSQLGEVIHCAEKSKCKYKQEDFATKVTVTGNLNKFITNWNKD